MDSRAKNVFPILHIKHVFLALEPPKIKIMTKNFIGMLIQPIEMIWHHFWVDRGGAGPPFNVFEIPRPFKG